MNNKGFAVSGIIYGILVLFILLMIGLLTMFNNRKTALDQLRKRVENEFNFKVDTSVSNFTDKNEYIPTVRGYYKVTLKNKNGSQLSAIMYLNKNDKLNMDFSDKVELKLNSEIAMSLSNEKILSQNIEFIDVEYKTGLNVTSNIISVQYINKKLNNKLEQVRYIKDCINGNDSNQTNYWTEIRAIASGQNVAKGKNISSTAVFNSSISRAVDGNTLTSTNTSSTGEVCVIVDLGQIYNLEAINVIHMNNVKYYGSYTAVSKDGNTYNKIRVLEEKENENGLTVSVFNAEQVKKIYNVDIPIKYFDNATWIRVFHHDNLAGTVLWGATQQALNYNTLHKQSILYLLDEFKNQKGKLEFLLEYEEYPGKYNRWKQSSNPVNTQEKVSGYESIHIDWNSNALNNKFGGLCKSNTGYTLIDGTCGNNNWFYSIGTTTKWQGGIPGFDSGNGITKSIDLWVRIDNVNLDI